MEINIISTSKNLDIILKKLKLNEFKVEVLHKDNTKVLRMNLYEYQLNLALYCIQTCNCPDLYTEKIQDFDYNNKITYPYAVVYIKLYYK